MVLRNDRCNVVLFSSSSLNIYSDEIASVSNPFFNIGNERLFSCKVVQPWFLRKEIGSNRRRLKQITTTSIE